MIKISTTTAINSIPALQVLISKDIKIKAAYQLAVIVKKINEISADYNKVRETLINKFAKKDEEEKVIVDEKGMVQIFDVEKFNAENIELLEVENELNVSKISVESFGNVEVSADVMMQLTWLVE